MTPPGSEDVAHRITLCEQVLAITKTWVQSAGKHNNLSLKASDARSIFQIYAVMLCAIVVKQHESLQTIVLLVKARRGFSAVPLLRAMAEEMIWAKYLGTLKTADAALLLIWLGNADTHDAFEAQVAHITE